jgi:excisionase family DNA binding protein
MTKNLAEKYERLAYGRREAAAALGISTRSIDYHIEKGTLRAKRLGGRVLIPAQELKRLVEVGNG